jgi:hypothetical protein
VSGIVLAIVREPRHSTAGNIRRCIQRSPEPALALHQRRAHSIAHNLTTVMRSGPSDFRDHSFTNAPRRDGARVRRRIPLEAGRGLEKLGHAVEYLTDEFVHDGCRFAEDQARLDAIGLLASLNRQIYFSCGIEPTFRERVHWLLRRLLRQPDLRN